MIYEDQGTAYDPHAAAHERVGRKDIRSAYSLEFYPEIGHSPVWPYVPHVMIELAENGLAFPPDDPPVWNDCCIAAIGNDGSAIGFLAYRYDQLKSSWFILLAWVAPWRRHEGIHTAMFNALVERANKRGNILSINCGTHVNNHAAQAAFKAQGREPVAIMYSYKLKDFVKGKPTDDIA